MHLTGVTPILNVSDLEASFRWFEQLGWRRGWAFGEPPTFGAVCSGDVELFLCVDGQGARGGTPPRHPDDDDTGAVWMSWWVRTPAEVDEAHARAVAAGVEVTWPPTDEPWGCRECRLRHPDGHTFRVSAPLAAEGQRQA